MTLKKKYNSTGKKNMKKKYFKKKRSIRKINLRKKSKKNSKRKYLKREKNTRKKSLSKKVGGNIQGMNYIKEELIAKGRINKQFLNFLIELIRFLKNYDEKPTRYREQHEEAIGIEVEEEYHGDNDNEYFTDTDPALPKFSTDLFYDYGRSQSMEYIYKNINIIAPLFVSSYNIEFDMQNCLKKRELPNDFDSLKKYKMLFQTKSAEYRTLSDIDILVFFLKYILDAMNKNQKVPNVKELKRLIKSLYKIIKKKKMILTYIFNEIVTKITKDPKIKGTLGDTIQELISERGKTVIKELYGGEDISTCSNRYVDTFINGMIQNSRTALLIYYLFFYKAENQKDIGLIRLIIDNYFSKKLQEAHIRNYMEPTDS